MNIIIEEYINNPLNKNDIETLDNKLNKSILFIKKSNKIVLNMLISSIIFFISMIMINIFIIETTSQNTVDIMYSLIFLPVLLMMFTGLYWSDTNSIALEVYKLNLKFENKQWNHYFGIGNSLQGLLKKAEIKKENLKDKKSLALYDNIIKLNRSPLNFEKIIIQNFEYDFISKNV
jgi:hypothetical protein